MSAPQEVSQRDLRLRSREIMDGVEHGQSYIVTRDGHRIGQLSPLPTVQRFVARADFFTPRLAVNIDAGRFRSDLDDAFHGEPDDPYAR